MSDEDIIKSESSEEDQPIKTLVGKPLLGNVVKNDEKDEDDE